MEKNRNIIGLKILLSAVVALSTIEKSNSLIEILTPIGPGCFFRSWVFNGFISTRPDEDVAQLCDAAIRGKKDKIEHLIKLNARINKVTIYDDCVLNYAITHDSRLGDVVDMVKLLVEKHGARINRSDCKKSPIDYARQLECPNITEYLQNHM
jgi:hypothetical protein